MKDLVYRSAVDLLRLLRAGELSIEETVRAFLNQISKLNPAIHALTDLRSMDDLVYEAKQKDAQLKRGEGTGKLFGLPMTVKDIFHVKGLISSGGHPSFRSYVPDRDAALVSRLKRAGAIVMGKTNLPLLSFDWQSTNGWFGRTNNPYDIHRVPGGSSGGAAAAVAMGFSPLELGSDAGGSIRVPAHFCGVCGLRPTEKALPNRGHGKFPGKPQGGRHITVAGPIAKNVSDLDLMMEVLWDHTELLSEIPPVPYGSSTWQGEPLKIAFARSINQIHVDEEYAAIFAAFIKKVSQSSHAVAADAPAFDEAKAFAVHTSIIGHEMDMNMPRIPLRRVGVYVLFATRFRDHALGKGLSSGVNASAKSHAAALEYKDYFSDQFTRFFGNYDIWITPVCALPAFKHQPTGKPFDINGKAVRYMDALGKFTFTTALSGHPILVLPIGMTRNGLPVGVQIHARKWQDKRLVEIGKYLERFTAGYQRPDERKLLGDASYEKPG